MSKSRHINRNKRKKKSNSNDNIDLDLSLSSQNNYLATTVKKSDDTLTELANSSRQINKMKENLLLDNSSLRSRKIINSCVSNYQVTDKFREIRTKLLQVSENKNFMIMVTSVCKSGGASLVATNLAAAFSFDDSKTALLVDCNLRNPNLHNIIDINEGPGLTNYLEDMNINIDKIITQTGIKRLRLIPAGKNKESVSEYFTSRRMADFLQKIYERYNDRYIIIDAPSLGDSPDASILSELCDFVLVVAPYGKVTIPQIEKAIKAIDRNKLVGVVFNN